MWRVLTWDFNSTYDNRGIVYLKHLLTPCDVTALPFILDTTDIEPVILIQQYFKDGEIVIEATIYYKKMVAEKTYKYIKLNNPRNTHNIEISLMDPKHFQFILFKSKYNKAHGVFTDHTLEIEVSDDGWIHPELRNLTTIV